MNKFRQPLIEVRKVKKFFPLKRKHIFQRKILYVKANEDVSLTIYKGETLGLVGESGCGKSTLGRVILQLYPPTSGSVLYYGIPLREANPDYVISEIKKIPKYQNKAKVAYAKSLILDDKIILLKEEIKNQDQNELQAIVDKRTLELETLLHEKQNLEKKYIDDTIQVLKKKSVEFKNQLITNKKEARDQNWENEVDNVIRQLEKNDRKTNVADFISLLEMPHSEAIKLYKKVITLRKQQINIKEKLKQVSITKLDKKLKKYEYKSKELKKQASRELRDGSKTAGEFILENNISTISKLMLEEELLHRKIYNLKFRVKRLESSKTQEAKELLSKMQDEIKESEFKRVEAQKNLEQFHFKDVLPITELCCDPEYQQKMENNREYAINLEKLKKREIRILRQRLQMIFQDPYSSLDPRMTVGQAISEAVVEHGLYKKKSPELEAYVIDVMAKCGLDHYMVHRFPHQFSGGQRQRIVIARALALNPEFVVCDESVSALDVSIQSQILNLLEDLKRDSNLTYLFISHDLSVIKHISNRIGVMYLGDLIELCESETLYEDPLHPYSKALISAIPTTTQEKRERIILEGDIPSNIFPPSGCKFRTRCPIAREKCAQSTPKLLEVLPGRQVACHFYEETKSIK